MADLIKRFLKKGISRKKAYEMGIDYFFNGASIINSHISIFSNKKNTAAWERGRNDAERRLKTEIDL